ncbi:hypothetical protein [Pontibacter oryzae]|uniref:Uncharacterized protein n=1 Tax=Pontibacter oryzae TaxID=2304593 RepID=A0A399RVE7_9BACT|nr:hypothetical protein [Pontibacter oryzae]RIJ34293.1 hypothetical protein D1627_15325 [Pontibacter oryzae]
MENKDKDYSHIKGWGIDADPKNDPTYPMRKRGNDDHTGYNWDRPTQQTETIEVLHSVERPNVTAVFGTSKPPKGLSGMIRRYAFQFGEGQFSHWLPLIVADRVDAIEGIVEDLKSGHIPNIFAEKGYKAQWKYNRTGVITKVAVATAVTTAVVLAFRRKCKD